MHEFFQSAVSDNVKFYHLCHISDFASHLILDTYHQRSSFKFYPEDLPFEIEDTELENILINQVKGAPSQAYNARCWIEMTTIMTRIPQLPWLEIEEQVTYDMEFASSYMSYIRKLFYTFSRFCPFSIDICDDFPGDVGGGLQLICKQIISCGDEIRHCNMYLLSIEDVQQDLYDSANVHTDAYIFLENGMAYHTLRLVH